MQTSESVSDIDIEGLTSTSNDKILLERERNIQRERMYQIGFKDGLFRGRNLTIQSGFDRGFHAGALSSFTKILSSNCQIFKNSNLENATNSELFFNSTSLDDLSSEETELDALIRQFELAKTFIINTVDAALLRNP